jgi:hypothetical protein
MVHCFTEEIIIAVHVFLKELLLYLQSHVRKVG